jgi:hypothetical protein
VVFDADTAAVSSARHGVRKNPKLERAPWQEWHEVDGSGGPRDSIPFPDEEVRRNHSPGISEPHHPWTRPTDAATGGDTDALDLSLEVAPAAKDIPQRPIATVALQRGVAVRTANVVNYEPLSPLA